MKSMELGLTKGQIGALMATADTSGDGIMSKAEIEAAPIRQKTVVAGMDLNSPPSSEPLTVPTL